ncbi:TM2 domain-containing protein CG10795-like isoform X2 [Acanthaster planci]|uniref:TM2 domain-containing protein CG10795-like isoform X2 n=2 Tax=Acanthaster planci TaxID=133434 RepID=A0A8B7YIK2_ACAPL|nr:TM2 domain-containing protein CG10795-like isoform X2 [Acanthaster planci]
MSCNWAYAEIKTKGRFLVNESCRSDVWMVPTTVLPLGSSRPATRESLDTRRKAVAELIYMYMYFSIDTISMQGICGQVLVIMFMVRLFLCSFAENTEGDIKCNDLQAGQYLCEDPEIDPETQAAVNCPPDRLISVSCMPVAGTQCDGEIYNGSAIAPGLKRTVPCRYTTGYSYSTSLLLSIFLGMFGVDRLYLGYPAIAVLKFCTVGLLFIGHFLDVILIAMQVVGPADGSDYTLDYYGPRLQKTSMDNYTYYKPITD